MTFLPFQLHMLLPEVVTLAEKAGEAVMKIYSEEDVGRTYKKDGSPLTRADMASHALIYPFLERLTPELPVLSEESNGFPYEERRSWQDFWLVDPLDGTKEFIQRHGDFTINIALISDERPVLGVVHAPVLNVTYFAANGVGAFKRTAETQAKPICVRNGEDTRLKVVVSRSHADEALVTLLNQIGVAECISMGSSLKACLVAEGKAHLYPRPSPTMEWDTAAAQCVVEAAGGIVTDLDGHNLKYNKPNLVNPHFLVSCDAQTHSAVLGRLGLPSSL
jgi:3'(2'), 5'-bisphosphate nucleotidase